MSNSRNTDGALAPMPPIAQALKGRNVLITGATGFLGKVFLSFLLRWHPELGRIHLLIRGDRRSALNRMRREILDSPVMAPVREQLGRNFDRAVEEKLAVHPGDIALDGLLAADAPALARGSIDAVVNCAGLVNFEASLEKALSSNAIGVANVVDFCRKQGAALMHISTCYAAGDADGQRYEDDIPIDWCPSGRRGFSLKRELRDAQAAIDRVEAESRDSARLADFHAGDDGDGRESALEQRRKRWVDERLKEIGRERALRLGWPNTYSYTKSLGEQIVFAARDSIDAVVVRPAVIESSLADPFPGWNQGVNTSAPLSYLAGEGYRFIPAQADLVLDVIPVDLAAHAIIPILAALLVKRHRAIYQLCTSDVNPLPMRRLIELTGLAHRLHNRKGNGSLGRLARHLEVVVASQSTYELASRTIPSLMRTAARAARTVIGDDSTRARRLEARIDRLVERTDLARSLAEVYRPYIQRLVYTFHGRNIRALYAALRPADASRHPFNPDRIDWNDYWINVHMPGLRRHIFPQLDLHTRGRPRAIRRFRSLLEMLDNAAQRFGSRPALISRTQAGEETVTTYRSLRDAARRAGLMLAGRGVNSGDRVLLIGENSPGWVLGYFAIVSAGAIAVPLDHLIAADELAAICRIAAPKAILRTTSVARRLGVAIQAAAPESIEIDLAGLDRPFILRTTPAAPPEPDRKTLASIVFTSGTTGAPKGVMLTHGNFAAQIAMLSRVFALDSEDTLLSLLPLHHTFEFTCGMLLPIASGARIVYPAGVDAASLARTLGDVRPTALIGVPALWQAVHRRIVDQVESRGPFFHAAFDQLRELSRRLDRDVGINAGSILFRQAHAALGGRLKLAVSGGSALPIWVAEFFNDLGIRLLEGYGLTEAAPVLSAAHPDEPLRPGSVGKALSGVDIRLATNGDAAVGEVIARGPNIMAGYYRNEAATAEVLKDGWLYTGDLGRLDADGRLTIVGRAKDVIVDAGGNNIYIDELEESYGRSPYLKELAIVGVTAGHGEQVAALAVPAYAKGINRRTVDDRLREHFETVGAALSAYKRIRILRFTDADLPRTRTRKIKRAEVVETLRRMIDAKPAGASRAAALDVEPWLAEAIALVTGPSIAVSAATRLIEDLGLDSLALAELAEHIAEHVGRDFHPDELANLATVADLQRLAGEAGNGRARIPSYARFAEPFTPKLPAPLRHLGGAIAKAARQAAFDSWLKPRILGRGNIPANRNVLVVANHSSHLDFLLIAHALGPLGDDLVVLAAKDYFFNTSARRFLAANFTPLIPFDRERAQLESLDSAIGELVAGRSVLMFPEGTRSPDGAVHDFKSGAGYLALRSGCDVLPIHVSGTHEVLGKGKLIPRHNPVEVRIGRVIGADELRAIAESDGAGAYRKLADHMREAVANLAAPRAARPPARPARRTRQAPQIEPVLADRDDHAHVGHAVKHARPS